MLYVLRTARPARQAASTRSRALARSWLRLASACPPVRQIQRRARARSSKDMPSRRRVQHEAAPRLSRRATAAGGPRALYALTARPSLTRPPGGFTSRRASAPCDGGGRPDSPTHLVTRATSGASAHSLSVRSRREPTPARFYRPRCVSALAFAPPSSRATAAGETGRATAPGRAFPPLRQVPGREENARPTVFNPARV